jgi:membrane associated rhomboid family serine protease
MSIVRRVDAWMNERMTPMVKLIVIINVAVFLLLFILDPAQRGIANHFAYLFGEVPARWYWIWQYLTYNFVHIGLFHLFFNMYVLTMFGTHLEQRWGSRFFLGFYLLTGVGAGLFHVLMKYMFVFLSGPAGLNNPVIGASGAICGLLIAFTAYYPDMPVGIIFVPIFIKMRQMLIILILLDLLMARAGNDNISHLTHLSGYAFAYILLALHHRDWDIRHWRWRRG